MTAEPRPGIPTGPNPPDIPPSPEPSGSKEVLDSEYLALYGRLLLAGTSSEKDLLDTGTKIEDPSLTTRKLSWYSERKYDHVTHGLSKFERTEAWKNAKDFDEAYDIWSKSLQQSIYQTTDEGRKAVINLFTGKDSGAIVVSDMKTLYDAYCKGGSKVDAFVKRALEGTVGNDEAAWLAGRLFGNETAKLITRLLELENGIKRDRIGLIDQLSDVNRLNRFTGEEERMLSLISEHYEKPDKFWPGRSKGIILGMIFIERSSGKKYKVTMNKNPDYNPYVEDTVGLPNIVNMVDEEGNSISGKEAEIGERISKGEFVFFSNKPSEPKPSASSPPASQGPTSTPAAETQSSPAPMIKVGMVIEEKATGKRLPITAIGDQGTVILSGDTDVTMNSILERLRNGQFVLVDQEVSKPAAQPHPEISNEEPDLPAPIETEQQTEPPIPNQAKEFAIEVDGRKIILGYGSGEYKLKGEDSYLMVPEAQLIGVFDGLGGHAAGEVASQIARDAIKSSIGSLPQNPTQEQVEQAFLDGYKNAAEQISEKEKVDAHKKGMATTASVVKIYSSEGKVYLTMLHVGDSRIYGIDSKKGELTQISPDYSLVNADAATGKISADEAERINKALDNFTDRNDLDEASYPYFSRRNVMGGSLNSKGQTPTIFTTELLRKMKYFIATSDGIHDNLTTDEIHDVFLTNPLPQEAADELIRRAHERFSQLSEKNSRSKEDDLTAVVLELREGYESS